MRSVTHKYNSHNPYGVMTGFDGGHDQTDYFARPTNHPSVPSVCQFFGVGRGKELPGYVMLPAMPGLHAGSAPRRPLRRLPRARGSIRSSARPTRTPAGLDPGRARTSTTTPSRPRGEPRLPKIGGELTLDALDRRRSLVEQLDANAAAFDVGPHTARRDAAFDLLLSPKAKTAFDLSIASRSSSATATAAICSVPACSSRGGWWRPGVTFVTVHTEAKPQRPLGHAREQLQHAAAPPAAVPRSRRSSALIDDLADRGLLESTLVVVTGDMGRTPKINGKAGRDHWPQCGFCLFAGGGTKPGVVHGTTDKIAAFPTDHPVSAGDLVATMYHLVGVDPEGMVPDHTTRPQHISHGGKPVWGVIR